MLVTYDYTEWLDGLYDYPERQVIGRVYSISSETVLKKGGW